MSDIFISYSRKDSDFVRKLVNALSDAERDVWVDFEDIPFATDWWAEINEGIEQANVGIFVLSPDSLASQICSLELSQLIASNKRIIPIVYRDISTHQSNLPETVSKLNWLFFIDDSQFEAMFEKLVVTLDTNYEATKDHTRLLSRANEWQRKGQNESLLLRGDELEEFLPMQWRTDLTEVQREYLITSFHQEERRKQIQRFSYGFAAGMSGLGYYIFFAFRTSGVTPTQITLLLAVGEVFGLFIGLIALLTDDVSLWLLNIIPPIVRLTLRLILMAFLGIGAWATYYWLYLQISEVAIAPILGGFGLAIGFGLQAMRKLPAWASILAVFLGTYLPIFFWHSNSDFLRIGDFLIDPPLIYFDKALDVYWIGLPMALLIAFVSHAYMVRKYGQRLSQVVQGRVKVQIWERLQTRLKA